jgi:hypothetical protein
LRDMNPQRKIVSLFRAVTRMKRWIIDTSLVSQGTTFFKDKVYLDWYNKIDTWISQWGDINRLFVGKIKIEDLDLIG